MKLAINLALSLAMLALFAWLAYFRGDQWHHLQLAWKSVDMDRLWPALAQMFALMVVVHLFRAWRWKFLLRPIGVELPFGRLMSVSTVGFMAILALPARLGEFVRPYLIREPGKVSMASALGTVAVERIVDGLLISLLVFVTCSIRAASSVPAPSWMMPTAYISLAIFGAAMLFLIFMLSAPSWTVRWTMRLTLIERFAPRLAEKLGDKMHALIRGFRVLKDPRDLAIFVAMSVVYWSANGLSVWVLARGFDLGPGGLSVIAAFTVMGLVAVGITLPNSPGLVGQYTWFTIVGLKLYLAKDVVEHGGQIFAVFSHATQVLWYMGTGAIALLTSRISLGNVVRASSAAATEDK